MISFIIYIKARDTPSPEPHRTHREQHPIGPLRPTRSRPTWRHERERAAVSWAGVPSWWQAKGWEWGGWCSESSQFRYSLPPAPFFPRWDGQHVAGLYHPQCLRGAEEHDEKTDLEVLVGKSGPRGSSLRPEIGHRLRDIVGVVVLIGSSVLVCSSTVNPAPACSRDIHRTPFGGASSGVHSCPGKLQCDSEPSRTPAR